KVNFFNTNVKIDSDYSPRNSLSENDVAILKHVTQEEIVQALINARNATPRVYEIVDHLENRLNIGGLGCQGGPGNAPRDVARSLNKIVDNHPELKPSFITLLGDNVYPDGVSSPVDDKIETQVYDTYSNPEFGNISMTPCCMVLGN